MKPQRMQLSRKAGYNLQAASLALNGLPGRRITRPGKWGNPFTIDAVAKETGLDRAGAQAEAVARHGRWMCGEIEADRPRPSVEKIRAELGGKNLACWCREGTPCHVETLIKLAND